MTETEKRVLAALEQLPEGTQQSVAQYAEFLVQQGGGEVAAWGAGAPVATSEPESPQPVEPDADEGPIKAIKRLRATYPMLERRKLLDETSQLISKRYLQDKPEGEVIAELEEVFERHYEHYCRQFDDE
jgi:hypothetical protein